MIIVHPARVLFGNQTWEGVSLVAIDRSASRLIEEWSDLGQHAAFVDAPEVRTSVRVVQELSADDLASPRPGQLETLVCITAAGSSDARRRRVSVRAVVKSVRHEVSVKRGPVRTVELVAASITGGVDPVSVTDAGDAAL